MKLDYFTNKAYVLSHQQNKVDILLPNKDNSWRQVMSNMMDIDIEGVTIITQYSPTLYDGVLFNNSYILISDRLEISPTSSARFFICHFKKAEKTIVGWASNDSSRRKEEGIGLIKTYFLKWYNHIIYDKYPHLIDFSIVSPSYIRDN